MATTKVGIAPMKVAQISKPGGDFEIVEREIPTPRAGQVRIKVQACGVCHSDVFVKEGLWPGIQYPRVYCSNPKVTGISYDGGYQQYMVAPVEALAAIPDTLSDAEAAPLLCAGVTTFNALRHSGALPGGLVAVQGVGGLGHLGIQFGNKFGYKVAAIGRGPENSVLAKKLGASVYIDSKAVNATAELQKLGGAQAILATAPSSKAMSELIDGLAPNGKFIVVGISSDPIEVTPLQLISGERAIQGSAVGTPTDSEDTLLFAELSGVRPMIETYPLERAQEAFARMMSGDAQFRIVLTM